MTSRFVPRIQQAVWMAIGLSLLLSLMLSAAPVSAAECEEGFTPIFDGRSLDGWEGDPRFWSVEDGAITGQTTADNPTEHNTFLIWQKGQPGDFVLRFDAWFAAYDGRRRIADRGIRAIQFDGPQIVDGHVVDVSGG